MKLAVTGHRPERLKGQEKMIAEWAETELKRLQPSVIYVGMARGADQIIATVAKRMNIPIICCFPFPSIAYWKTPTEQWIMENNRVICISPHYSKKSYWLRDKYMIDNADKLLCVWDGVGSGGTFITRNYAIQQGKEIIDYKGLMKL